MMATLTFVDYDEYSADLHNGVHNLGSDTIKIALTNSAPNVATDSELADITEISAGNGYTAGGEAVTIASSTQTGGTYSLTGSGTVVWTASGGAIADFRYLVLYNDTATNDELIGYYDYGSTLTLNDGDDLTVSVAVTLLSMSFT
jgi:hypothetical protein